MDPEGDEFYDAGAEPSSPSVASRASAMSASSSGQRSASPGAAPGARAALSRESLELSSRGDSFKDAPGPSELWGSDDGGTALLLARGRIILLSHHHSGRSAA